MARYRVRGILRGVRSPVIHKVTTDSPYAAATEAARIMKAEGHDPAMIESLTVKEMGESKTQQTYFGKPSVGRKAPGKPAETPAPAAPATPVKPAETKPEAKKPETPKK